MHYKIRNFRDLGGIPVKEGHVKHHKLLRGGPLYDLDDETVSSLLNEYHLKMVIDLRSDREIEEKPNKVIEGVEAIHLDIMTKAQQNADPEKMALKYRREISTEHMKGLNRLFVESHDARDEYRIFFKYLLKNKEGALYFHCTAGKDRTGFAAAQILKILGASDEAILADYLETNTMTHELVEKELAGFKVKENLTDDQVNNIRGYMTVDTSYLKEAWDAIEEIYGDFETYVSEGLLLSEEDVETLKKIYIEY
ncbi:tyrosine-protein phosphatase [Erysipelothrix sp. strain 2 (EsS2-6-Brazil)]|uniref:tyrosine-protein phosphatase n=1 Tax=Erysipelothrix sp. strain 2 (EsS2-6-Brazil) TaxID=2500549 RepID=UPI00190DCECD|nr:tyrosine-protein phosphatase [Erysipelothrix sp. strain 2 (EsS2-6-Brazil)]MBK2403039.1 tyrosine-protein phosphatase [Erysipelothrix sp. strain 2 (EsS2-6-Brazil)]